MGVDIHNDEALKDKLEDQVAQLKQIIGLEKRVKLSNAEPISVTELDAMKLNQVSFQLQNLLFDYCGIKNQSKQKFQDLDSVSAGANQLFGRIKKLPVKSTLFHGFPKDPKDSQVGQTETQKKISGEKQDFSQNYELIKVIGLEPEKLFKQLDKYKVEVHKMPRFSNIFDSYENYVPGLGGSSIATNAFLGVGTNQSVIQGSVGSFARQDGRAVISLNFNPYELDNKQKKKIYEGAVKEIQEVRSNTAKQISITQREKQEQAALKRAWTNIAKKDIPKAFRAYQKYKADQENNTKKLAQAALREVRKKAVKTQRIAKESTMRAKKLTKEMLIFWKKRDKELADIKRKKEKFDKEMKKRQQEEEEALLQKKRLEYLMKQSEIYAHFMANKMGMSEELKEAKADTMKEEKALGYRRVDVDEQNARKRMAKMINEDKKRLREFDYENANDHNMLHDSQQEVEEKELDVNRFDLDGPSKQVAVPKILLGDLKHYQLRGLKWLDNLYEQGINGILADEMGLGKTIQAISLMAHIAEARNVWGPFLVVVPVTTLHNWKNELEKFCPALKVLPYFGSPEERKKLGRFLDTKNMNNPQMQIHVIITSYNLIVNNPKDQAKLMKIKWNYMILDEAQAIKNNASRRWKVLLNFNTRNRLLLTGTPIQNSMQELWALLHFIMPKLFDNHEQFAEWFSKDIEASSMDRGELNKHQLKRLHAVLKPFMLRRLKRDVEQEIGPKTEVELFCDMTFRQRILYQRIRDKISAKDLFTLAENKQKMENLMNLVMQFRKVCNHPDLFERKHGRSPFVFRDLQVGVQPNLSFSSAPEVRTQVHNPIRLVIPKLIFDDGLLISDNNTQTFTRFIKGEDISFSQVSIDTHAKFFNIFNAEFLHREFFTSGGGFGILRLQALSNGWSASDYQYLFSADQIMRQVALIHYFTQRHYKQVHLHVHSREQKKRHPIRLNFHTSVPVRTKTNKIEVQIMDLMHRDNHYQIYREAKIVSKVDNSLDIVQPMIPMDPYEFMVYSDQLKSLKVKAELEKFYVPPVIAESIQIECPTSGSFQRFALSVKQNPPGKKVLYGDSFKPARFNQLGKCSNEEDQTPFMPQMKTKLSRNRATAPLIQEGIMQSYQLRGMNIVDIPKYGCLVTDCAKMRIYDELVTRLYAEKHRCLVFCQMTRMIDILEDFMTWKKMSFFRLDGSTSIADRRYMVEEYQRNDKIFAFLLSTRAGGLGINLISADTVIFYDNDWNPTMDEQATDRAHRIGQTKPVTVYRIITRGTVEEKIVKRAQQKQNVQSTVYGDTFKMKEVVQMVMGEEMAEEQQPTFIKTRKGRKVKNQSPQKQASPAKQKKSNARQDEFEEQNYNDVGMYDDDDSDEEDDGQPAVTFRYEEDEDREAGLQKKAAKLEKKKKQMQDGDDQDDCDMMVDDY